LRLSLQAYFGLSFPIIIVGFGDILFLRKRRREAKPMEKEFIAEEKIKTKDLLKEIEDLRKILEKKK